jgi:hypothetical protein
VLRDDGVSYGDHVEQITCLLFLKMDQDTSAGISPCGAASWRRCRQSRAELDALRPSILDRAFKGEL